MKKIKKSPLDAVKAYYIAHELLGEIFNPKHKTSRLSIKDKKVVVKKIKKVIAKADKLSLDELLKYNLDGDHHRYDNYYNSTWELKEVLLEDCGSWPQFGGLPHEITKGSISDTVDKIRPLLEDKNKLSIATGRLLYIEELMKYVEDIIDFIPIIVMEDGVIRHNKLRPVAQRRKYKKCKYDIDDGNHRATALGLLGKKKVLALVGKRIYKNKILY